MTIKVSEVQINFIKPTEGIIAFASLVVNDAIYISSIAIHKKLNSPSYRLTYPTRKLTAENSVNLFYPINKQASLAIEQAVFRKLKEVMNKVDQNDRYSRNGARNW